MRQKLEITKATYQKALEAHHHAPRNPWQLDAVRYDRARKSIVLVFPTNICFSVPVERVHELAHAKVRDLESIHLTPSGETLVVEGVDAYISSKGLISDILGALPREILTAKFASIGGAKRSALKKKSSVENGRKGGRPKKSVVLVNATTT